MTEARSADAAFMERALFLAERGRGRTTPNPIVGAVVVSPEGIVVGQGAHLRAGTPHAEIHALETAGERARGATLYCTLEPCSHVGRTGPCARRDRRRADLACGRGRARSQPAGGRRGPGVPAHPGDRRAGGRGPARGRAPECTLLRVDHEKASLRHRQGGGLGGRLRRTARSSRQADGPRGRPLVSSAARGGRCHRRRLRPRCSSTIRC